MRWKYQNRMNLRRRDPKYINFYPKMEAEYFSEIFLTTYKAYDAKIHKATISILKFQ
jgi:hypothetical protein